MPPLRYWGVDWDDPELYDLVLNMDHLTIPLAADIVTQMASSEEVKARSMDAMQSLAMMALARRTEAALIEKGFPPPYVSVCAVEPRKLRLTGTVGVTREKANVEKIVKAVQGVTSIDSKIHIAAAFNKGS